MADRDSVTVVWPASMSSAHCTNAVGVDDEEGLTMGALVMLEGWRWLTEIACQRWGQRPSLAHLAQKQSAQTMKTD